MRTAQDLLTELNAALGKIDVPEGQGNQEPV